MSASGQPEAAEPTGEMPGQSPASGTGGLAPPAGTPDGPQWVLEYWSDLNNVFQFVRIEDIAYEKRGGKENRDVVYIVDSGRGRRVDQSLDTPNFKSTNGRVWRMELDKNDGNIERASYLRRHLNADKKGNAANN